MIVQELFILQGEIIEIICVACDAVALENQCKVKIVIFQQSLTEQFPINFGSI